MPQRGVIPPGWALGLLSPIPKEAGSVSITTLRPICLQNVLLKRVPATIYLILEDVEACVTPSAQKAFIQGHFIFDHMWDVRGAWEAMQQGLMVSLDFSKAYDTVHHNYFIAFFLHVGLPIPLISLLMTMFKAQFVFAMGRGVVKEVLVPPQSRVKQGDPLSPAVFVMVCSVIVHESNIPKDTRSLLCTRPPAVRSPSPRPTCALLPLVFEQLRQFGLFGGLQLNLSKSAFLTQGM